MTKQIKIDVLDVGFHLWTDDEKQHGYTNLTDLLDGLRGLLSDEEEVLIPGVDFLDYSYDGWIEWDGRSNRPSELLNGDMVEVMFKNGGFEPASEVEGYEWGRDDVHDYIVAYRVVRS